TGSLTNSRMEQNDRAFVTKARSGDKDAFRTLVERHGRGLFRLAFRMTGNAQDAEDVVQESFLRAWRQLDRFDERASFGTWMYRIATNCALDVVRLRKRRSFEPIAADDPGDGMAELPSLGPSPERMALSGEVRQRLAAAMNQLSETERAAFVLRHFEGLRLEEISQVLECQPGAAKHSVFRAVQKLRRALEPIVSPLR
ncbi:MAG: sigma-70 family RNA polymerase sigma factor, partial [Bryobacteraceae bacterium]